MSKFIFCSFVANSCHKCSKGKLGRKIFFTKENPCWFFVLSLVDQHGKEKFLVFYHYLDRINQKDFFQNERSWKLSVCVYYVPVRHDSNLRDGWEYRNLALQKTDNYLATSLCVLTQYDMVHRKNILPLFYKYCELITQ